MAAIAASGLIVLAGPANTQGPPERLLDRDELAQAPPANQPQIIALPELGAEKQEDAVRLLVVGDFMARGLADALADTFAGEPGIVVIDRSNGSSGLVRDDFYDWSRVLPDLLEEVKSTFVVIMIGTNDRQGLRTVDGRFDLRSGQWDLIYFERVSRLAEILAFNDGFAFWVGQPPMRSRAMSADMAYFNSVYEDAAGRVGIRFIDIWDAFADQDGRFAATGPDVDGQNRVLRADDGFSFTAAGRAKAAFFIASEIQLVGDSLPRRLADVPDGGGIEIQDDGRLRDVGQVMVLGDPPANAAMVLITEPPGYETNSLVYRLLVRGEAFPLVAGRVDDFTWPRPGQD